MLVFRPSRYLARVMRVDPVKRQSLISSVQRRAYCDRISFHDVLHPYRRSIYPGRIFSLCRLLQRLQPDRGRRIWGRRSEADQRREDRTPTSPRLPFSGCDGHLGGFSSSSRKSSSNSPRQESSLADTRSVVSTFTNIASNSVYGRGMVGVNQIGSLIDTLARILVRSPRSSSATGLLASPAGSLQEFWLQGSSTSVSSTSRRPRFAGRTSRASLPSRSGHSSVRAATLSFRMPTPS